MRKGELNELDQIVKRELRKNNMLGKQANDERLYLKRGQGGRGLKLMRDVYAETRTRVACYMCKSNNKWIQILNPILGGVFHHRILGGYGKFASPNFFMK